MSRVLKSQGAPQTLPVRSLRSVLGEDGGSPSEAAAMPVDSERLQIMAERSQLLRRLEQQDAEMSLLRAQVEAAFQKGEALGREAGRRETNDLELKRLALLEKGIEQAVTLHARAMSRLENLAPRLAQQGLAGILGAADDRGALVTAIVRQQLKVLDARTVLHIDVSAADFADEAALGALADALGASAPSLHADSALKSGDCRIKLKLGTLDVGLEQQWGRLAALLGDLSQAEDGQHG